ncbi:MAG: TolC family protein [Candidatus Hydrogenedentes bacterium]|nr:TolC family protein [Candidatus Hydrogenedentota bacterium]
MKYKTALRSSAILLAIASLWGCGTVRPEPDFLRTAGIVTTRTGIDDVYDPAADALVQARVDELIQDGLTPDDAVRIAFLNNRAFQAQFYAIGASRADVVQSGLLSNPTLSLSLRLPGGGGRSNIGLGLAQEIVDLWQIPVRKKIASEQLEQVILGVVQSAIALKANVETQCCELLALQESQAIAQENRTLAERSLSLAQGRFDAGESGLLDVNLARANLLDVQMSMVAITRDVATTRSALAHALGLAADGRDWSLTGTLPAMPLDIEEDSTLVLRAAEERLDVQIAASELNAAKEEIQRQHRSRVPSIVVGADGERTERRSPKSLMFNPVGSVPTSLASVPMDATQATDFVRDFLTDRMEAKRNRDFEKAQNIDFLLGPTLQVTLPIWDQNRAQIAKAQFNAQEKQKMCEELLETVVMDVQQAAAMLRSANELVRFFTEDSLPLAQGNIDTALRTYAAGEETMLTVIEAQKSLMQQRESYIGVLKDQAVAIVNLERVMGGRIAPLDEIQEQDEPPREAHGAGASSKTVSENSHEQ